MDITWFIDRVVEYLGGPFLSWANFLSATSGVVTALTALGSKTAWPYLLTSIGFAYGIYLLEKKRRSINPEQSFWNFVFPREIYLHRSSIVDYKFAAVDLTIGAVVYLPLFSGIGVLFYKALISVLGESSVQMSPTTAGVVIPIVAFVLTDFSFFLAHYLMHKVSWLWPFHEVHHSAEVLNPVTVYRAHPMESLVNGLVGTFVTSLCAAGFTSVSRVELDLLSIFGVNIVLLLYFAFAFQLRHSHIWLSYGPLSWIFISPAQHQIHHSMEPRHVDKNFGFTFAIWDAMFGCLYVPKEHERFRLGVAGADPEDFSSVAKIYFLPFRKAAHAIMKSLRRTPALAAQSSRVMPGVVTTAQIEAKPASPTVDS